MRTKNGRTPVFFDFGALCFDNVLKIMSDFLLCCRCVDLV